MIRHLTALAIFLASTAASAKPIPPASSVLTLLRPYNLEEDVPLNTRIWLDDETAREPSTYASPREPRLFAPDEVVVPLGEPLELVAAGGRLRVYSPPTLSPNTTYELRNCEDDDCSHHLATFTTAIALDSTAPAAPEIHDARIDNYALVVDAEFADDILVIGRPDASAEPLASRDLVAATTDLNSLVLAEDDLPSYQLRFATYDLAGHFSGWTEPHEIDRNPAYACSTTTAPAPWYLLLPILLRRRKPTP